jgi:hypothetical protein
MPKFWLLTAVMIFGLSSASAKKVDIIGSLVSGKATITSRTKVGATSVIRISIDRINAELDDELGRGDVIEAWLVDEGTGTDDSRSSADTDDNDLSFDDEEVDEGLVIDVLETVPYALSLGTLEKNKGNYTVTFNTRNSFAPYDYIMLTQESRGNRGDYDPRPGTQLSRNEVDLSN